MRSECDGFNISPLPASNNWENCFSIMDHEEHFKSMTADQFLKDELNEKFDALELSQEQYFGAHDQ